jgi:hypothetical protein
VAVFVLVSPAAWSPFMATTFTDTDGDRYTLFDHHAAIPPS